MTPYKTPRFSNASGPADRRANFNGKPNHPYMKNNFKGTEEIQETFSKMYAPDEPVKTVYDFTESK